MLNPCTLCLFKTHIVLQLTLKIIHILFIYLFSAIENEIDGVIPKLEKPQSSTKSKLLI